MTTTTRVPIVLAFLAGCFPVFEQEANESPADEDSMYGDLDVGRPIDAVRAASFGVGEITTDDGTAMPVVHVRLTVNNPRDQQPWRIEATEATLTVPGFHESRVLFINSDVATLPIARVERRELRTFDLFFPYPDGFDDATAPPALQLRVVVRTPWRAFTWFGRVERAPATTPAVVPGAARYWWSDPARPWPTYYRRGGRKTPRPPTRVQVTQPPRWPVAVEPPLAIQNRASRGLREIRLSPVVEHTWGANLIGTLPAGGDAVVPAPPCTRTDVLFIDDQRKRCVLPMVQLCFDGEPWVIDDVTLDQCRWE